MTSRIVENVHTELLNQLLSASGLECVKPLETSTESSSSVGQTEEPDATEIIEEEHTEATIEEQVVTDPEPEVIDEPQAIFPTPSLRLPLSEEIRKIQQQNRIHVLPWEFKTDIDPQTIPKIATTAPQKYIDILADMIGCSMYKSSLAEFWFLDTLANLLRRAQDDQLDKPTQAVLILWFCEWMKEMQHFDAADRHRMMKRFQDNMLQMGRVLATEEYLPTPVEAGVNYTAKNYFENISKPQGNSSPHPDSKHFVKFEGAMYECYLQDLIKIIHYIFDLFNSDYQYNLVRSVFCFTPDYTLIDAPYQIQQPKKMYAPLKVKKDKSPRKEKDKKDKKGKKKEVEPEEYIAMMELKAKEDKYLEEQEEIEREAWNRKSHILPLAMAADEELFHKYWPPPPPVLEPEPVAEVKGKNKKGKGKKGK